MNITVKSISIKMDGEILQSNLSLIKYILLKRDKFGNKQPPVSVVKNKNNVGAC